MLLRIRSKNATKYNKADQKGKHEKKMQAIIKQTIIGTMMKQIKSMI